MTPISREELAREQAAEKAQPGQQVPDDAGSNPENQGTVTAPDDEGMGQ